MNKAELITAVAQKTGLSKKDSEKAVCAVFDSIAENLREGGKVQIVGFGAFEVRQRAAHIGRNPRTKEEVRIPATCVPAFRAGKALKDEIAK
jgi:DNA-binding protein HU-beta